LYSTSHGGKRNLNIVMETLIDVHQTLAFKREKIRLRARVIGNRWKDKLCYKIYIE